MVNIQLDNVSVRLNHKTVVDGVSAKCEAGSLIGVIGPNGAGKSTLIRAAMGLLPISSGSIRIDGQPLEHISQGALAKRLAYLPQGQNVHWPLSVRRLVALGRIPHLGTLSHINSKDTDAIEASMEKTHVLHLAERNVLELSGGERARVLLARALAVQTAGLIADEPLASLDPGHQIDVMNLLRKEADQGALVITVMHDLTLSARYCDRLLLIDKGKLVADGAPPHVLTPERLASVYGITAWFGGDTTSPLIVPIAKL